MKDENILRYLRIIKEVTLILEEIHKRGYGHNNIHCGNVVVDEDLNPTIVGFGLAAPFGSKVFEVQRPYDNSLLKHFDMLSCFFQQPSCWQNDIYSFALAAKYFAQYLRDDDLMQGDKELLKKWTNLQNWALQPFMWFRPDFKDYYAFFEKAEKYFNKYLSTQTVKG